jgi:8-amino-7-oxononanoate synthase
MGHRTDAEVERAKGLGSGLTIRTMMNDFDRDLTQRLEVVRQQGLLRELRRVDSAQSPRIEIGGRTLLNFASNDYLGLANEPALKEAAIRAVERYGAGAGGSRLICGSLAPHQELDESLAAFKGTEAALSFSTGYAAAIGAICALLGKDDFLILDKLVHACIVDAAHLCGAKLRVYDHNDLNDLEAKLKWTSERVQSPKSKVKSREGRALVVTESVFSMDGDHASLHEIVALKEKHGAWLMVDEAHATGLYGAHRRGLAEELGISSRIEVQMGTLGKALGASGGYIAGSRVLIDYLINRARSFIFSTAPVPAAAAAAIAGIRFVESSAGEERRSKLWQLVSELSSALNPQPSTAKSAIIPILIGEESKAVETAAALRDRGTFIPAIRYPTVARGQARLRLTLSAAHTHADLAQLLAALKSLNLGLRTLTL